MKQSAFIGINSIENLNSIISKHAPQKIFLVRGKKSYELSGAKKYIDNTLYNKNIELFEYSNFEENPKWEEVLNGVNMLQESKSTLMIAIGGGSVIDMAKLIRFYHSYSGEITNNVFDKKADSDLIPLVALPTTSGSGAEATHFAVVYKDKIKYSVAHSDILPDFAVIHPPFTYNNPQYLTACTGFDALAQAVEAYWNVNATEESDEYALKAIQLLYQNLPEAVNAPTESIRNLIAEGAHWAGRAINITKTTAPHAFSYPFTTYYNYPHGHAVALTFPFFMAYNYGDGTNKKHTEKMDKLYSIFNIDGVHNAEETTTNYLNNINLTSKNINFSLDVILDNVNIERLSNNPIAVNNDIKYFLNKKNH